MKFVPTSINARSMRKCQEHAEHREAGDKAKTAVADKWKRDTGHWQCSRDAANIYECLKSDKCSEPDRAEFAEHITRIACGSDPGTNENDQGKGYQQTANAAKM